jgi:glucokinase
MVRLTEKSVVESGTHWSQMGCMVVGAPGPLNATTGTVLDAPNLTGWKNVPVKAMLEDALGVPVRVVNDANAAALGEFYFGAGRGYTNLVYLTISTGIGGGVVVDGRLLEGASGTAGEIGHMTIDRHGPVCRCGNLGCLEAIASGTAIARRFQEGLAAGQQSAVTEWLDGRAPTAGDVARGAAMGDPLALAIFTDAAEAIGLGVVNCVHIFNPDVIALGGGVSRAGSLLFDPIRKIVECYAMAVPRADVRVVPAELGDDVGLVGAAAVAQQETLAAV